MVKRMPASRIYERQVAQKWRERGYLVIDLNYIKPNFPGYDLAARKLDSLSLKPIGSWILIECKSGRTADDRQLTPTQKRMLDRFGEKYIVERNKYFRDDRI